MPQQREAHQAGGANADGDHDGRDRADGGGAEEAEAPAASDSAWALDEALKAPFPQSLEMVQEIVLDRAMPAQRALARWESEREAGMHRQDSTGRESRRLAALGCVLAAFEALDRKLPRVPVTASSAQRDTLKQVRRALGEMHDVFDTADDPSISDEKVAQLVELTGLRDGDCRRQLRLSKGDVNRAAGRLMRLREQDAETHDAPAQPTGGSAGNSPLPRQGSAGSDTAEGGEAPAGAVAQGGAEPADEHDIADAPEPEREQQEIYGENHAFYANRRQIRSSHGVHHGTGRPPTLPCLRLEQQSSWGYAAQVLTFQGGIEDFHDAFGRMDAFSYSQLEGRHDYIQWLFPSPERSRFVRTQAVCGCLCFLGPF